MATLEPTPGPHVIRRLLEPPADYLAAPRSAASSLVTGLVYCHNQAVKKYGSDCGGFHVFDPVQRLSLGVHDGVGGFPSGTVVTNLAWGRITGDMAQRILEGDGLA